MTPSLILRKLGTTPRQSVLSLARREIGRIERTIHTLDWIEDKGLRVDTTDELNKGEARHPLARAVAFHRLGRFRDRNHDQQSAVAARLGSHQSDRRLCLVRCSALRRRRHAPTQPRTRHPGRVIRQSRSRYVQDVGYLCPDNALRPTGRDRRRLSWPCASCGGLTPRDLCTGATIGQQVLWV